MELCSQCGEREAVIRLTQVVDDKVTNLHLCERCAAEKGVETGITFGASPLGGFLAAMGKESEGLPQSVVGDLGACLTCGATLQDFRETGRVGCAECYAIFRDPLRTLLRRLHGSTHHTGKRYSAPGVSPVAPSQEAADLRSALGRAVQAENFELAAELRDRLKGHE